MRKFFGYIRVSTARQGERGVSLPEQRSAIERHAQRNALAIVEWFEERQTAAKRGRPVFAQMLNLLREGRAEGVVIHKIDRSARNLRDWADLGELIDGGIEVHFANESLDLRSRGGRLSADIQAVVAADYIRNLREEARKGIIGRLKQGLLPLPAPVGYLDRGRGKPKEMDPLKAPLVKKAFELYGTGRWNLDGLLGELHRLGLRNRRGGRVSKAGLSGILNNPFYIGLIRIKRTGETYEGVHQPLITKTLFDRVGAILRGRTPNRVIVHDFLYRRLFSCAQCGYSLIGERKKGHVYYRCHTKECPTKTLREEVLEEAVLETLSRFRLDHGQHEYIKERLGQWGADWDAERASQIKKVQIDLANVQDRLLRLTDAYLDGVVERRLFDERKAALFMRRKSLAETVAATDEGGGLLCHNLLEFLELAKDAENKYKRGLPEEKRELIQIVTSNRRVDRRNVAIDLLRPFAILAERPKTPYGGAYRARPRTLDRLMRKLVLWVTAHPNVLSALVTKPDTTPSHGGKAPQLAA